MSRFTSDKHEWFGQDDSGVPGVCITTYSMLTFSGRRSAENERIINVRGRPRDGREGLWGPGGLGARGPGWEALGGRARGGLCTGVLTIFSGKALSWESEDMNVRGRGLVYSYSFLPPDINCRESPCSCSY